MREICDWRVVKSRQASFQMVILRMAHTSSSRHTDRVYSRRSSFRFETRVTTPHFELCSVADGEKVVRAERKRIPPHFWLSNAADGMRVVGITNRLVSNLRIIIDGSVASRALTMCPQSSDSEDQGKDEDAVSWTGLIDAIHSVQWRQFLDSNQTRNWLDQRKNADGQPGIPIEEEKMHIVALRLKTRSWDLMPPDIVRPLASTTLGTILAVAHRMGMTWKDVRPSEGRLRAEGFGQSFSATLIRGLGIVVEYAREAGLAPRDTPMLLWSLRIPTTDADKVRPALPDCSSKHCASVRHPQGGRCNSVKAHLLTSTDGLRDHSW